LRLAHLFDHLVGDRDELLKGLYLLCINASKLIAPAPAGLWREKVDQHSTGTVSTVWVGWEGEEDDRSNADE
jgi:hypothetical protein